MECWCTYVLQNKVAAANSVELLVLLKQVHGCKLCGVVGFAKSSLRLQIMLSVGVCLQILWSCWFCKIKYMAANSVELLVLQNEVYGCKFCGVVGAKCEGRMVAANCGVQNITKLRLQILWSCWFC